MRAKAMLVAAAAIFAGAMPIFGTLDFSGVSGIVIAHSRASTKKFIDSPSICILPSGAYLACHDFFGANSNAANAAVTTIYRSDDRGATWKKISETNNFWSEIFYFRNAVWLIGCQNSSKNFIVRRSDDEGLTWTNPTDASNGLIRSEKYHTAPTPVLFAQGRIWRPMETNGLEACVISIPEDGDLLKSSEWSRTKPFLPPTENLTKLALNWREGNAVERKSDGKILDILRVHSTMDDTAAVVEIVNPGKAEFRGKYIHLQGACKKFTIRYDEISKKYYALSNWIPENMRNIIKVAGGSYPSERTRNTMALISSKDLEDWKVEYVVAAGDNPDTEAFQYPDWVFDGDDIAAVSRTAWFDGEADADNQHNANFMTFHRIKNFRSPEGKFFISPQTGTRGSAAK